MKELLPSASCAGRDKICSTRGTFTALALDPRQNRRRALHPHDRAAVSDDQPAQFK